MKANKKALALVLCALMLVAASVFGTLAYLVDTDNKVTNTFTVGNVVITLDEAKVDENGVVDTGAARVTANTYKLMPGHKYTKDPIVHIDSDSEYCFVFVKIENGISEIEINPEEPENNKTQIATQMAAHGWSPVAPDSNVYYYGGASGATIVSPGDNLPVFESFTVNGAVKNATLSTYNNAKINVYAYAIQADGFDAANVSAIWGALTTEYPDADN